MLILAAVALLASAPPDEWDGFRSQIAMAGDVDCDGIPDLLVASRGSRSEVVWALSGRDGSTLLTTSGEAPGSRYGCSLAGVGDLDADGHADFVVGASGRGLAEIRSGRDASLLHRLQVDGTRGSFGACVAGGGDADGDGVLDVVVTSHGQAHLFSGRSGWLIGSFETAEPSGPAAIAADLDGDDLADVIAGSRPAWASVHVSPGLEKAFELSRPHPLCDRRPSWALAVGGDSDGDGTGDLLVSRIHCGVALFSGRTLQPTHLIADYASDSQLDMFAAGSSVDWIGDADGDGCDDLVIAAKETDEIFRPSPGFAHVVSGRSGQRIRSYEDAGKRMDACRGGDVNQDGLPDVAVFVLEDQVVSIRSSEDLCTIWEASFDEIRRSWSRGVPRTGTRR